MASYSNILFFINIICFFYFTFIVLSYGASALLSSSDVVKYHKESTHEDYESILSSSLACLQ